MKKTLTLIAALVALPAGMALASPDCVVPQAEWQPKEAVAKVAQDNGWTIQRLKTDDGCYEIDGKDANGRWIEVTLDPGTLRVIELDYEDDMPAPTAPAAMGSTAVVP